MATTFRREVIRKVDALLTSRRLRSAATLSLVVLGPLLVLATFLALGPLDRDLVRVKAAITFSKLLKIGPGPSFAQMASPSFEV